MRIWDVTKKSVSHTLSGHSDWVTGVKFSADGKRLISLGGEQVIVWNVDDWSKVSTNTFDGICVSLLSDGNSAAVGGLGKVVFIDLIKGDISMTLDCKVNVHAIAVSGDKKMLAIGENSGKIKSLLDRITTVTVERGGKKETQEFQGIFRLISRRSTSGRSTQRTASPSNR